MSEDTVRPVRHLTAACLALCAGLVTGHAVSQEPAISVQVYKADGSRQCEHIASNTLASMRTELVDAGVTVYASRKGYDGREGIALCGSPTGQINIYEIGVTALQKALALGFRKLTVHHHQ